MNAFRHLAVIWLPLIAWRGVPAQVRGGPDRPIPERILQLARDARKVKVSLKLDRDVYFPGEEPIVSVLFRNPTSQVLQVPEPVQGGAGGINLLEAEHDLATVKLLGSPWRHILVGGMLRRPEYGSATVRAHSQPAGTAWGDIPDRCLDHRWLPGEKPALARMGLHVSRE